MNDLINNANPKHNPITTILGVIFVMISAFMYAVKYFLPAFFELKKEVEIHWYAPIIPLGLGLLLLFMNDSYFARLFDRADKVAAKKTDTDK